MMKAKKTPGIAKIIGFSFLTLWLVYVGFALHYGRQQIRYSSCASNLRCLHRASIIYAQDYDEKLPVASSWMDLITTDSHSERLLRCPELSGKNVYGYAFNRALSSKKIDVRLASTAQNTSDVLIYDSNNLDRNATDYLSSFAFPFRHYRESNHPVNLRVLLSGNIRGVTVKPTNDTSRRF